MRYIDELKSGVFFADDLGKEFRVKGARAVEIPTRDGLVIMYGIDDCVLKILSAKRVKNFEDALLVLDHQYKIGFFDLDTAVSSTVMIYLNEMARRSYIKSFIVMDLLNRAGFSIIDIPRVIGNLKANAERMDNKDVG